MQCTALKNKYDITTAGLSAVNDSAIKFIPIKGEIKKPLFRFHHKFSKIVRAPFTLFNKLQFKLSGQSSFFSIDDYNTLKNLKFDLIISHHPATLALAFQLKEKYMCQIIFNAHEIYPYEFEDDPVWMKNNFEAIDKTLKMYLPKCNLVFSVNKEICDLYQEKYNCRAIPVHNSKPYSNIAASQIKAPLQIIHHGGAMPQRKLDLMAEAVLALKGKYELTFMLVNTNDSYLQELKRKYELLGVKFIEPVPYNNIITTINHFDIGLYILPQGNINQQLALPNKIFEFLQAKLAIISSPNLSMKSLIMDNGIGCVSEGFDAESMIKTLKSLTPEQINIYKKQSEKVSEKLSSANDEKKIAQAVNTLLN